MTESPETPVMSYSRMNSILTCGEQFRLQRKLRVPENQHWASVAGSAIHKVIENQLRAEFTKQSVTEKESA